MYRRLDDFRAHWEEELIDTLKVIDAIPDAALPQAVTPEHRDLRRLAAHLATSITGIAAAVGLAVAGPQEGDAPAPTQAGLREAYEGTARGLLKALEAWTDADLDREDLMFGHLTWKRGYTLQALEMHQSHHRGQMTVLLRQAGLPVPEFYGPPKEGWAALGMAAPAV